MKSIKTIALVFVLLISAKEADATFISPKYESHLLSSLQKIDCNRFRSSDIACMACNIYFLARSKSKKLQLGVALVTLNRKRSGNFPSTVCGVVWDKYQFSWTLRKKKHVVEMTLWVKAVRLSYDILNEPLQSMVRLKMSNKVMYFHDNTAKPHWVKKMNETHVFDGHKFYAPKDYKVVHIRSKQ